MEMLLILAAIAVAGLALAIAAVMSAQARRPPLRMQREVEQVSERIGLPTRSEMDAAHRRIAELERSLRRLQAQVAVLAGTAEVDPVAQPAPAKVKPVARKAAKKAAPAKKSAAAKPPAKKAATKKAPAKPAARRTTARK